MGRIKRCTANHDGESMHYRNWNVGSSTKRTTITPNPSFTSWKKLVIVLIIIFIIYFLFFTSTTKETYKKINTTNEVTLNQKITDNMSLKSYFDDIYESEGKQVILTGFLKRYIRNLDTKSGVYVESIIGNDQYPLDLIELTSEQKLLFPEIGVTDELYEVEGVFIRTYKKLELEAISIKLINRNITKQLRQNQTINMNVTNNMSYLRYKILVGWCKELIKSINWSMKQDTEENTNTVKTVDKIKQKTSEIVDKVSETVVNTSQEITKASKNIINETKIENEIFIGINEERKRKGRPLLLRDTYLDNLAKSHSEKMLNQNFFEHSNHNLGENIFDCPIHYSVIGCGSTLTSKQQASCMVKGWIESPGHHANMIDYSYIFTGIGVSCDMMECKATQNFK